MKTARQGKEILVKIHNDVGIMRDLAKIVAEKGVNLLAASSWVEGKDGYIRLITDDNLRAKDALVEAAPVTDPAPQQPEVAPEQFEQLELQLVAARSAANGVEVIPVIKGEPPPPDKINRRSNPESP